MCDYIERFSVLGITSGYPDGTYRPGSSVTRGQMAAFIIRTVEQLQQGISRGGVIGCPGQVSTSTVLGDDILIHTSFVFRNFNDTKTINIDRMIIYDADGTARCDFPNIQSFPVSFKSSLLPHQSTRLFTADISGCITPQAEGGIQTVITWSVASDEFAEPLFVTSTGIHLNLTDDETFGWAPVVCQPIYMK
jgi:hypothetical protein